jgi:hypothetical protein
MTRLAALLLCGLVILACGGDDPVSVTPIPPHLTIQPADVEGWPGMAMPFTATATGLGSPRLEWSSSDTVVVVVDSTGVAYLMNQGTAQVTVTAAGTEIRASAKVVVHPPIPPLGGG